MKNLDDIANVYKPGEAAEIENDLILHWYPERIIRRYKQCDDLLELGIGHGFTAPIFNASCANHTIIEGSKEVIQQFKKSHENISVKIIHDFFESYNNNKLFDVIIMGFILEHVDSPELIVQKYKKYLKPDGKLYASVPNGKSLNRRYGLELGIIDDLYSLNENDIALGHQRQYCLDSFKELFTRNGYCITHVEGIYLKPLPLDVLATLPDFKGNLHAMLRVGIDYPDLCIAMLVEVQHASY